MDTQSFFIIDAEFLHKIKTLSPTLAAISLGALHRACPNLIVTDVVLHETAGNVAAPSDRMIAEWVMQNEVTLISTKVGELLRAAEIAVIEAAANSIDEVAQTYALQGNAFYVRSQGKAWFRLQPVERAHLELRSQRSLLRRIAEIAHLDELWQRAS